MSEKLNPENYYENYRGWNLGLLFARIKGMELPRDSQKTMWEKDKVKLLILGSATTDNLNQAALIDHYLRPLNKVEQDEIIIIDKNEYPVLSHKKEADWLEGSGTGSWDNLPKSTPEFPYPKFQILQADMRQLPLAKNTCDAVISDYTLNYLDNLGDVEKTFQEISEALLENGLIMLSVRGNDKYSYLGKNIPNLPENDLQNVDQGGVEVHYFPLQTYINLAQKHKLRLMSYDLVNNDMCAFLVKE